jgi:UDP-N-acetylglucosamine--N-acetylmuramyl-(pentapeptide) pyrophosphoryl-undecaprenol N-acetylglucosamine transferase
MLMSKDKRKKRKRDKQEKIVFTGGGSGGHTMTAMAVIDEILKSKPQWKKDIVYVGGSLTMEGEKDKASLEERIASQKKLNFVKIRSGKLQRHISLRMFKLLGGVFGGIIDAWRFFRKNKVKLVFSSGGYVAVPVCFVAWLRRIPVVIHEQTTRIGLSNKISSIFARKILIGFEEARKHFPKRRTKFTGNTVRDIFKNPWKEEYIPPNLRLKLESFKNNKNRYPVILISGGGQGSHLLNTNVALALRNLLGSYQVILITGTNEVHRDFPKILNDIKRLSQAKQDRIILSQFAKSEYGAFFDLADLFVGRSGAMTVYDLGATKTPAIFIPIPWVTHNEQYHNAEALVELGLADILRQGVLNPEILVQKIDKMLRKIRENKLEINEHALEKTFVKDGAKNIYNELKRYL